MLDRLNQAACNSLARARDGLLLLRIIGRVLRVSDPGNRASPRSQKVLAAIASAQPQQIGTQPRQLSEAEMNWYTQYSTTNDARLAGRVNVFNSNIRWQLPAQGTGYVTYTPNDLTNSERRRLGQTQLNDQYGYDQIATRETIQAAINIAADHYSSYPNRPLQYGDFSRPGGINTPDHSTHNVGMAWDMRYLRNDNSTVGITLNSRGENASYDRQATIEFIRRTIRLYPQATFYANDPNLISAFPRGTSRIGPGIGITFM